MTTSSYSPHPCQGDGQIDVGVRKGSDVELHGTDTLAATIAGGEVVRCLERNGATVQASRDVHVAKPNLADGYLEGSPR